MSGPFENRTGPHARTPAPTPRAQYEGTGKYDDRHIPAEPAAEAAPVEAAPVEAAAVAPTPAAPPPPVTSAESLQVLPMDLDELLGNATTAPVAAVAPEAAPAAAAPAAVAPAAATPGAKEASMDVLPVDIEALLGSKLG